MKLFSKLKQRGSPFKLYGYRREWRQITQPKSINKEEALSRAETLMKEQKFIKSLLLLSSVNRNIFPLNKDLNDKKEIIAKYIKDELILSRYMVFKKYLSAAGEKSKLYRSFLFTLLIFSLSFYFYFGSVENLSNKLI